MRADLSNRLYIYHAMGSASGRVVAGTGDRVVGPVTGPDTCNGESTGRYRFYGKTIGAGAE